MVQDGLWRQFEGSTVEGVYVLRQLLGAGSYGGVFLADHCLLEKTFRQVAVKLILPDQEHLDYQLPEISRGLNLKHENVIRCHSAGEVVLKGTRFFYLILELADGGTLQQRLRSGPLPPHDVADLVCQAASGLEYLHSLRIVHRDIKPGNLLRSAAIWKISDLGAIRQMTCKTLSQTQLVFGTLRFMPPEALTGTVSPAWDLWSLGVVTVEALTGKPVYEADSEATLQGLILRGEPLAGVRLPDRFEPLVNGCLRKEPHDRWTARQVLDSLRQSRSAEASSEGTKSLSQSPIECTSHRLPPGDPPQTDQSQTRSWLRRKASEAFLAGATDEGFRLLRKIRSGQN